MSKLVIKLLKEEIQLVERLLQRKQFKITTPEEP